MTVPYTIENKFGSFRRLFCKWKGSIFKLVWIYLIIFLALFFFCTLLYRHVLNAEQQQVFEKIVKHCEKYGSLIPVSFVLAFYVSLVIGRWWAQYLAIPWIDSFAIYVSNIIRGDDEEKRILRRTICRYVCLSITQCFTLISSSTKKRFPTNDHFVKAGLLSEDEKDALENITAGIPKYQTHWIPLVWASNIITQAREDKKIDNDSFAKSLIDEMNKIKDQCNLLLSYDRIRVPLVYTQVVSLAVYSYFLSCLMGRQWIHKRSPDGLPVMTRDDDIDMVVPIFTILQFLFYIGWLKVAESLVNPFGEDDYDFELNWLVDRHLKVSYTIVDKMHFQYPALSKDSHWDEMIPENLPHTKASIKSDIEPPVTSTATLVVSEKGKVAATDELVCTVTVVSKNHVNNVDEDAESKLLSGQNQLETKL